MFPQEMADQKVTGKRRGEQDIAPFEEMHKQQRTSPDTYLNLGADLSPARDYETRKQAVLDRLARATQRQERRVAKGGPFPKRGQELSRQNYTGVMKKNSNRIAVETPFGSAHLGRGPYNAQPFLGLEPDEWETATPRTHYDSLLTGVASGGHEKEILTEMSGYMATNGPVDKSELELSERESQSATALSGILPFAEPHQLRNEAGGKPERAALRYAQIHGVRKTFNRRDGAYPPAHAKSAGAPEGGTNGFRRMRKGKRPMPENTLDLLEMMSDSSGEESGGE